MAHRLILELSDVANKKLTELANEANVSREEILRRAMSVYETLTVIQKVQGKLLLQIEGVLRELKLKP